MKVFQIVNDICYWEATRQFPSAASTVGYFSPDTLFVEAPDYVFEGWGYDPDTEGDDRFIQPMPPDGWLYDPETGTFYEEGYTPPVDHLEQLRADVDFIAAIAGVTLN